MPDQTPTDQAVTDAIVQLRHDEMRKFLEIGMTHYPEETPLDLYAYRAGMEAARSDTPFAGLIMAALYRADSTNARILRAVFPGITSAGQARYDAPGGILPSDSPAAR